MEERKIAIVIPSYQNSKWYERNLSSVLSQEYNNYRVIYTDDCSSDKTGEIVEQFKEKNNFDNLEVIKNKSRVGAMENLYNMIHSCDDDEIIITLDGDDWLSHEKVLSKINQVYSDGNTWMSYGQYKDHPHGGRGCSTQIPAHITQRNAFRKHRWCSSHLRTFYTWLFKRIKKEDLMQGGKFYTMTWDLAFMFPMLEMSGPKAKFIPDILYIYNVENPINDSKVNLKMQQQLEMVIRNKQQYGRLNDSDI